MKKFLFLVLISFFFTGCVVNKAPYTKRTQLVLVDKTEEERMGIEAASEILRTSKLSTDKRATAMVKEVGQAIARVSGENFNWEFHLIEDEVVNAFCLPAGKVFVYSGLLNLIENKDELATVIAHEVAHAIARHGVERMSMQQASEFGKNLITQALGVSNSKWASAFDMAYGLGSNVGLILPYSRKQEFEADKIGLILMAKAGYELNYALSFWNKMQKMNKGSGSGFAFLNTHPTDEERIKNIEKLIPNIILQNKMK